MSRRLTDKGLPSTVPLRLHERVEAAWNACIEHRRISRAAMYTAIGMAIADEAYDQLCERDEEFRRLAELDMNGYDDSVTDAEIQNCDDRRNELWAMEERRLARLLPCASLVNAIWYVNGDVQRVIREAGSLELDRIGWWTRAGAA